MRKWLFSRLIALLLVFLLFSASIMIVSVLACRKSPAAEDCEEKGPIIESLQELSSEISDLPEEAFENTKLACYHRRVLGLKVRVVLWQVKVGAHEGAVNKLRNDISGKIEEWIVDPWKTLLVDKVDYIVELIEHLCKDQKSPTIVSVLRFPETPNYDEIVTVIAQVIDKESGVESVVLSYQVNSANWINVTMNLNDGLYVAEIPPQPYDTTVSYKIYAYDKADNLATSQTYSYPVIDSYPPTISNVEHVPASPNYNETVTVSANVTEPPEASGVKNVTLWYRTNVEWQHVEMVMPNGLWTATIPGQSAGVNVKFYIDAYDNVGNGAETSIYNYTVKEPPNILPVARFSESAGVVYTGEIVTFDASESYDPDGTIISYRWDFGDDTNATGAVVEHAYSDDGNYLVTLIVTDDDGATATATATKYILNRPPVAIFTESAEIVYTGEVVTFNASSSYDPDGTIISYFWDFGDGTNAAGAEVDHAYLEDGVYTVTLTVTDDDGASSSTSATKTVWNRPPVASFTENATTVLTGEVIRFDASSSSDSDGSIISYNWDFGDGTIGMGVTVDHAFADDGIYIVILAVIDNDGATISTSTIKTVLNRPPVALFSESAEIVDTGVTITFDATDSYDPDGVILSYVWNFGDGTKTTGVTVDHIYDDNGVYNVTLTVVDDDGANASTSAVKSVSNRPPIAYFTKNATIVKKGEVIHFDASESYDLDGDIMSYFWDFGDGTTAADMTADHAYAEDGNYTVTLTVTDNDGASSSTSDTITVEKEVGWPLALVGAIGWGVAALTATLLYGLYRRRRKKKRAASNPGSKPVVTLYVPAKLLAGYN